MEGNGSWGPVEGVELAWQTFGKPEDGVSLWKLTFKHPHDQDKDVLWRTDARVVEEASGVSVSVQVSLEPQVFRLAPLRYELRAPRVVRDLTENFTVRADGLQLSERPKTFGVGNVDRFADLLLSPSRILPVVVATRARNNEPPVARVHEIGEQIVGLAHVFVASDMNTTYRLSELVSEGLSAYGGAVRLYWPGLMADAIPYHHPLWTPDRIAAFDASERRMSSVLFRILAPVAAMRIPVSTVEQRLRRQNDEALSAELTKLRESAGDPPAEWAQHLEEVWDENRALRDENRDLLTQVLSLKTNFDLVSQAIRSEADPEEERGPQPVTTMKEAVTRAADECGELIFLESAFTSAANSTYKQPDRVYHDIVAFDRIAAEARTGGLGMAIEDRCRDEGVDFAADVSATAKGKYKGDYRISHEGTEYVLGPHLKFGEGPPDRCARVYMARDTMGNWLVGHVGRHLRDETA